MNLWVLRTSKVAKYDFESHQLYPYDLSKVDYSHYSHKAGDIFYDLLVYNEKSSKFPVQTSSDSMGTIIKYGYELNDVASKWKKDNKNGDGNISILLQSEGEFTIVAVNLKGAVVINDRFGARPCYYTKDVHGNIWCSNNVFVLGKLSDSSYDLEGIVLFIKYGHSVNGLLPMKGVFQLPPASIMEIKDHYKIKQYWNLNYSKNTSLTSTQKAEQLFDLYLLAVQRRFSMFSGVTKLIGLSGGLDSRLLVYAAHKNNQKFKTFTLELGVDHLVAQEVANKLSIDNSTIPIEEMFNNVQPEEILKSVGPTVLMHSVATNYAIYNALKDSKGCIVYGAWSGDVLAGSYIPDNSEYFRKEKAETLTKKYLIDRGLNLGAIKKFINEPLKSEIKSLIENYASQAASNCSGENAAKKITLWAMGQRQPGFSFVSAAHSMGKLMEVSPCLDYRFNELMLSFTDGELQNKNLYHNMIFNKMPELRCVIYGNTGKPIDGKYKISKRKYFLSTVQKTKHAARMLLNFFGLYRKNVDYFYNLRSYINNLIESLDSNSSLWKILNRDECIKYLKNYLDKGINAKDYDERTIGSLVTLMGFDNLKQS